MGGVESRQRLAGLARQASQEILAHCRVPARKIRAAYHVPERKLLVRIYEEAGPDAEGRLPWAYDRMFHRWRRTQHKVEDICRDIGVLSAEIDHAESVPTRIFLAYNGNRETTDVSVEY